MGLKPRLLKIYKNAGETPLEAIGRIRDKFPDFSAEKMTYAGRLDPLAEGVLLILVGEECKNKAEYLGLDKEYEVEFLLEFKTDTGDVMGMIKSSPLGKTESHKFLLKFCLLSAPSRLLDTQFHLKARSPQASRVSEKDKADADFQRIVTHLVGKKTQSYPKYSSPRLCGKEGKKEVEIKEAEFLGLDEINSVDLLQNIIGKIGKVRGDFRQEKIIEEWEKKLAEEQKFCLVKCRIVCTSGTYIRVLAEEFGEKLNTSACVYSLKRTRVGETVMGDCMKF